MTACVHFKKIETTSSWSEIGFRFTPSPEYDGKTLTFTADILNSTVRISQMIKTESQILVSSEVPVSSKGSFTISTILNSTSEDLYCIFTVPPSNIGEYYLDNFKVTIQ